MSPPAAIAPANACQPRRAADELVYRVVAAELDGFLAEAEARVHSLPSFVESTFRAFLTCGIPEHGFLRVHCDQCDHDRVVAFSCRRRGACNSCGGRRMAETAARRSRLCVGRLLARAGRRAEAQALLDGIADRFAPRFSAGEAAAIEPLFPLPPAVEFAA